MTCRLVALKNNPGVRPVGVEDNLSRAPTKLVLGAAGDQAKILQKPPNMHRFGIYN